MSTEPLNYSLRILFNCNFYGGFLSSSVRCRHRNFHLLPFSGFFGCHLSGTIYSCIFLIAACPCKLFICSLCSCDFCLKLQRLSCIYCLFSGDGDFFHCTFHGSDFKGSLRFASVFCGCGNRHFLSVGVFLECDNTFLGHCRDLFVTAAPHNCFIRCLGRFDVCCQLNLFFCRNLCRCPVIFILLTFTGFASIEGPIGLSTYEPVVPLPEEVDLSTLFMVMLCARSRGISFTSVPSSLCHL